MADKELQEMVLNENDEIVYAEIKKQVDSSNNSEENKTEEQSKDQQVDLKSIP